MKIQELVDLGDGATGTIIGNVQWVIRRYSHWDALIIEFVLREREDAIKVIAFSPEAQRFDDLIRRGHTLEVGVLLDGRDNVPVCKALRVTPAFIAQRSL